MREGYPEIKPPMRSAKKKVLLPALPIIHKPHPVSAQGAQEPELQLCAPLSPLPFTLAAGDPWCFDMYRYRLLEQMCPYFESSFWTRFIMMEAMTNESVRHSVISLGALGRAILSEHERQASALQAATAGDTSSMAGSAQ